MRGRPLTGARIETTVKDAEIVVFPSRPLTGARIETFRIASRQWCGSSRPLTGARIETWAGVKDAESRVVAPSRGRGSKHPGTTGTHNRRRRPLTGARIETCHFACSVRHTSRRPLTGARIETAWTRRRASAARVAPSRGRGSKHRMLRASVAARCRPLTGARIET